MTPVNKSSLKCVNILMAIDAFCYIALHYQPLKDFFVLTLSLILLMAYN